MKSWAPELNPMSILSGIEFPEIMITGTSLFTSRDLISSQTRKPSLNGSATSRTTRSGLKLSYLSIAAMPS